MVEEREPIDIGRIVGTHDREIIGFEVTVNDIPGALAEVSRIFAEYNINLVHLLVSRKIDKPYVDIIIFADFTGNEKLVDEVTERLMKSEVYVTEVKTFTKQLPNLIAETRRYPLTVLGKMVVAFREPILKGMLKAFVERIGRDETHIFLWHLGLSVGRETYFSYKELGAKDIEGLMKYTSIFTAAMGWAIVKDVIMKKGGLTLQFLKNWECSISDEIRGPRNHLMRGILAGMLSEHLGKKVEVRETKCIGMGDPFCELEASWE